MSPLLLISLGLLTKHVNAQIFGIFSDSILITPDYLVRQKVHFDTIIAL